VTWTSIELESAVGGKRLGKQLDLSRELLSRPPGFPSTRSLYEKLGMVNREQASKQPHPHAAGCLLDCDKRGSRHGCGRKCESLVETMSQTEGNACKLHLHSARCRDAHDKWNVFPAEQAECSYFGNTPRPCWRLQTKQARNAERVNLHARATESRRVRTVGMGIEPALAMPMQSKDDN
jgi:hypothetical protein